MCAALTQPNIGAMTYPELLDRSEFLKRAAALGLVTAGVNTLDPIAASAASASRGGLTYRGITYDIGTDHFGESSRLRWTRALMEGEIDAIRDRLHCNAAERLRMLHPGRVTLIVGCEHSLFTPGIVPGDNFLERIAFLVKGLICEFGCCTYKGAPQRGGSGYDIVDYDKVPPELIGKPVRSEDTQARYIAEMFDVFESQNFLGTFVYTFISPDAPSSKTPKHNMDTAAFSVVKVVLDDERDLGSRYRWETKRAFHAIARHNRLTAAGRE